MCGLYSTCLSKVQRIHISVALEDMCTWNAKEKKTNGHPSTQRAGQNGSFPMSYKKEKHLAKTL